MTQELVKLDNIFSVDVETGEVLITEEQLKFLDEKKDANALAEADYVAMRTLVSDVGERIARKMEQAARLRAQVEKRCKPLDEAADWLFKQLIHPLKLLAPKDLPKYHSGKNAGKYTTKTLMLDGINFSFTKSGGTYVSDKTKAAIFVRENCFKYPDLIKCLKEEIDEKKLLSWIDERRQTALEFKDKDDFLSYEAVMRSIVQTSQFVSTEPVDEFSSVKPVLPK